MSGTGSESITIPQLTCIGSLVFDRLSVSCGTQSCTCVLLGWVSSFLGTWAWKVEKVQTLQMFPGKSSSYTHWALCGFLRRMAASSHQPALGSTNYTTVLECSGMVTWWCLSFSIKSSAGHLTSWSFLFPNASLSLPVPLLYLCPQSTLLES